MISFLLDIYSSRYCIYLKSSIVKFCKSGEANASLTSLAGISNFLFLSCSIASLLSCSPE
nr:MAG TPA: hypothetical protein [Bacteriophage sp.]